MQIWLDTIDLDVITDGVTTGIISGVTTNPSILSQTRNVLETLLKILEIQPGPVAVQVTSTDSKGMVEEGQRIFDLSPRMIVKVPVNRSGLIAIKELHARKVPTLGTGILFAAQALLASNQGTDYIAPYFNHIYRVCDAQAELKTMTEILKASGSSTKILAASILDLDQLVFCASLGVSAATIKADLYRRLLAHQPIVESFFEKFQLDWSKVHGQVTIKEALDGRC